LANVSFTILFLLTVLVFLVALLLLLLCFIIIFIHVLIWSISYEMIILTIIVARSLGPWPQLVLLVSFEHFFLVHQFGEYFLKRVISSRSYWVLSSLSSSSYSLELSIISLFPLPFLLVLKAMSYLLEDDMP
jgi:hypothetical protein